jgi:hypothetical protein
MGLWLQMESNPPPIFVNLIWILLFEQNLLRIIEITYLALFNLFWNDYLVKALSHLFKENEKTMILDFNILEWL